MKFDEIGQLRFWFDDIGGNYIFPNNHQQIKKIADNWLVEKQNNFHGAEYLEKIEGNSIYLSNASYGLCFLIAYYCSVSEPVRQKRGKN